MSIKGSMVGGPPAVPDWNEVDPTSAGYIKNKPNVVEKTGGSMTGELNVLTPTKDANAANKGYVDAKHFATTATLSTSGWSSSAPYSQTISIAGMAATDTPHVSPVYSGTLATAIAQQEAWSAVNKAVAYEGKITFVCFEDKPTTDIPIQLEVNR